MIGITYSIFGACVILSILIITLCTEKWGPRPVFLVVYLGCGLSLLGSAFSTNFLQFIFSRAMTGFFTGNIGAVYSYLFSHIQDVDQRLNYMAYVGLMIAVSYTVGPSLGGLLSTISLQLPFYVLASMSFLGFIITYFSMENSRVIALISTEKTTFENIIPYKDTHIIGIVVCIFCNGATIIGLQSLIPMYLLKIYTKNDAITIIGYLLTTIGLFQSIGTFIYPLLKRKIGLLYTGAIGGLIYGLATISVILCTDMYYLFLILLFAGLGNGILQPSLPEYLTLISPEGKSLEYVSIYSLIINLAILVYSQVTLLYAYSSSIAFILTGIMSVIQCFLMTQMKI